MSADSWRSATVCKAFCRLKVFAEKVFRHLILFFETKMFFSHRCFERRLKMFSTGLKSLSVDFLFASSTYLLSNTKVFLNWQFFSRRYYRSNYWSCRKKNIKVVKVEEWLNNDIVRFKIADDIFIYLLTYLFFKPEWRMTVI